METVITFLSQYGFILIIFAAYIDEFFLTGYFLYGFALIGSIAMLYATDMVSIYEIFVGACIGTILASFTNYFIGYHFGNTPYIQKLTSGKRITWMREKLEHNGMFLFILVCRFVTITRPIYALLLGTLRVPTKRFIIFEIIVGTVWISFWTAVLIFGAETLSKLS